jgi:Cdc6-like AAA superfamily ATPase
VVIDELKSFVSRPESSLAFFYFDYQDADQQTPNVVLSSLLNQIVNKMSVIPKCISDAFEKQRDSNASLLPLDELLEIILDVLKNLHQTTIIIDAIDECDSLRHRKPFLNLLQRLTQVPTVRLFVTSRQNFQDITEYLNTYPQIVISAQDYDLKCYMYQEIKLSGVDDIVDDEFANDIIEEVIFKAQGV